MFRLKIWGLTVCLALLVAEAGNAAPRAGGLPAPRGEVSWLDLETLWARAWNWLAGGGAVLECEHGSSIDPNGCAKHGAMIDPNGGKHGSWEPDPGIPLAAAGSRGRRGPVIGPGRSN